MANIKIIDLPSESIATDDDLVVIRENSSGTTRKITKSGFLSVSTIDSLTTSAATVSGNLSVNGSISLDGTSSYTVGSITSAPTITPTTQIYDVTALGVTTIIAAPSFVAANGMSLILRIKDNGTSRAISFSVNYLNVSGLDTPTATVANKLLTIGAIYNSASSKWEIQGINQQA